MDRFLEWGWGKAGSTQSLNKGDLEAFLANSLRISALGRQVVSLEGYLVLPASAGDMLSTPTMEILVAVTAHYGLGTLQQPYKEVFLALLSR